MRSVKNVILVGDSIRFGSGEISPGYGRYVKENLSENKKEGQLTENKSMDEVLLQLNKLKASDLASMSNNGLFTNLSSLVNSNSQSLSNNENLVLNKILVELNDIKEKQNSLENKILREPKILKTKTSSVCFSNTILLQNIQPCGWIRFATVRSCAWWKTPRMWFLLNLPARFAVVIMFWEENCRPREKPVPTNCGSPS